jgi:hypothetical protein
MAEFMDENIAEFLTHCKHKTPCYPLSLPMPENKPLDSSARKSLIYIGVTGVPSGLHPVLGGAGRRENTKTESKTCRLLAEMTLSAVRKNPQEPAQTHGSRKKKANPEGLVFPLLGWGLLKEA